MLAPGRKPIDKTPHKTTSPPKAVRTRRTPKPTDTLSQRHVLSLLAREEPNSWLHEQTCGWYPDSASEPFTCPSPLTCATDPNNIVGCASDSTSSFFAVCFDYSAFRKGDCSDIDTRTGCCRTPSLGACGTCIWPGDGAPSMFMCFDSSTVVKMLEVPRSVLEASTTATTTWVTKTARTDRTMTTTTKKMPSATKDAGLQGEALVCPAGQFPTGKDITIIVLSLLALIIAVGIWYCCRKRKAKKANEAYPLAQFQQR